MNKNLKLSVVALSLLLIVMSVGYAAYSVTLYVTGEAALNSYSWNIHYVAGSITQLNDTTSDTLTNVSASQITKSEIDTANQNLTFAVNLEANQKYEFTVGVTNEGNIDGLVKAITLTSQVGSNTAETAYTALYSNDYLTYSVKWLNDDGTTADITMGDTLNAGVTKKYKVSVKYTQPANASLLPSEDTTFKFTLNVAYSQASYLADGDSSYDTVAAKEVSYTPSDASWNVSSVQEAIDYLYENS